MLKLGKGKRSAFVEDEYKKYRNGYRGELEESTSVELKEASSSAMSHEEVAEVKYRNPLELRGATKKGEPKKVDWIARAKGRNRVEGASERQCEKGEEVRRPFRR